MGIQHILVGVDGSAGSKKAARFALDLAQQVGARLTLLFVIEPPSVVPLGPLDSYAIAPPRQSPEELAAIRALLDQLAADLPQAQIDKRMEFGQPVATLCEQAATLGADLIVVGARGLSVGGRWLLGSVSDRVVHHAGRPVTVVH